LANGHIFCTVLLPCILQVLLTKLYQLKQKNSSIHFFNKNIAFVPLWLKTKK